LRPCTEKGSRSMAVERLDVNYVALQEESRG
jgi:hypothetical protein